MKTAYFSFSRCAHVSLNGRLLPDLPCCHVHNCGGYHGMIFINDTEFTQTVFDPSLPPRIGAYSARVDYGEHQDRRPNVYSLPGFDVELVLQLEGGRCQFLQINARWPLQGFLVCNGQRNVQPGVHTIVFKKQGISELLPASGQIWETLRISLSRGNNILFGIVLKPNVKYEVFCADEFLPNLMHEVLTEADHDQPLGMSYKKAIDLANMQVPEYMFVDIQVPSPGVMNPHL